MPIDGDDRDGSDRQSFLERLGVRKDEAGGLVLEVRAGHLRSLGIAHGGLLATLLDSVMGMAAARSTPADHYLVTAQLNVHFIRPAFEGETLRASSQVRHQGLRTAVAEGEVRTETGSLVATGSATFVYVAHTDRTREQVKRLNVNPPRPTS